MAVTSYHLKIDVRGALAHWCAGDWRECVRGDDGRILTPAEVREEFERLAKDGVRFMPFGECDGFDPVLGCPGHAND